MAGRGRRALSPFRASGSLDSGRADETPESSSFFLSFVSFLLYIVFACDFPNSGSFGFHGFLLFVLIFLVLRQRE